MLRQVLHTGRPKCQLAQWVAAGIGWELDFKAPNLSLQETVEGKGDLTLQTFMTMFMRLAPLTTQVCQYPLLALKCSEADSSVLGLTSYEIPGEDQLTLSTHGFLKQQAWGNLHTSPGHRKLPPFTHQRRLESPWGLVDELHGT